MTWTNKDKTRWVDLDKVSYFDYSPEREDGVVLGSALIIVVDGYEASFYNDDADAIYKILSNQKRLL